MIFMITNLWKTIKIYCGNNHDELVELQPVQGPLSLFYACPKYYEQNREKNEKMCDNRLNLNDYNALVEHLTKIISEAEEENMILDLTGYKWKNKGVSYEIFKYSDISIKVKVYSTKSIGKYTIN